MTQPTGPLNWRPLKHFSSEPPQYGLNISASEYTENNLEAWRLLRTTDIREDGSLVSGNEVFLNQTQFSSKYQLRAGDLLYSRSGTVGRSYLCSSSSSRFTFAGYLVRFRPRSDVDPRYLDYCSRTTFFKEAISADSVTSTISNFNAERYKNLQLPWRTTDEQRRIADYLDRETTSIDALISKKRRLIELLNERRSNFVSSAVTMALEKNCEPVDTSNRYVRRIPKRWRLMRLRHVVEQIIDTPHKTAPVVDDGEYLVVRTSNVKKGRLILDGARYTDRASWLEWNHRGEPRPGDVLLTREAPAGEACIVPADIRLCIGQRMVLLRVRQAIACGEWVVHSIYSRHAQRFITDLSNATTVAHLNVGDIPDIPIAVPDLREQQRLLIHIRSEVRRNEETVSRLNKQIDFLAERRRTLITAVITGPDGRV